MMTMLGKRLRSAMLPEIAACKSTHRSSILRKDDVLTSDRFCGQDEYHDPGADFEDVLACAVCGDNGKSLLS